MPSLSMQSLLGNAELPELPPLYYRLQSAVSNPDHTAVSIGDILGQDPSLSSWMLRISNSSLFQPASPIETVEAAIELIGRDQIGDLALGVEVIRLFNGVEPDIVSVQSFWHHGIACGIVARAIAAQRHAANIERLFMAGLLHDIGSLLLYCHISEQCLIQLLHRRDVSVPLYQLERQIVGFDHADLGGALLREWALPEPLWAGVAYHHAIERATDCRVEAAIVHVADIVTHALELGSRGEYCVPPLAPAAWELLDLPVSALSVVIKEVDRQMDSTSALLMG